MKLKWIITGVVSVVLLICAFEFSPFTSVPAGSVGIVSMFGKVSQQPLQSGLNFVSPMAHVTDFDVQQQSASYTDEVGTKDLQSVTAKVTVNYHANPATAPALYVEVGPGYAEKWIAPAVADRLKGVTGRFTIEELVTKREDIRRAAKAAITDAVREKSGGYVVVDDVLLNDVKFSAAFTHSIEQKQIAEQSAQKATNDLQRIKVEAQQKVAQAEAEAAALKAQKDQITPELLQLRRIEAQIKAIEKWDGHLPNFNAGGTLPFLNIQAPTK